MFLVPLEVECTLSDGSVEQYPQSTFTYRLVLLKFEAIAYTGKRQAKQPCLDSEREPQKATDALPQYGWMTYMYRPRWLKRQHVLHDSSNDSDSDSNSKLRQWRVPSSLINWG